MIGLESKEPIDFEVNHNLNLSSKSSAWIKEKPIDFEMDASELVSVYRRKRWV